MSLFSWLFPRSRRSPAASPRGAAAGPLPRGGQPAGSAAAPVAPAAPAAEPAEGLRKNERVQRREQLYTVVRDVMVRAGVLSAGYKFKVLSLDQRGAQFLIMVDMAPEYGGDTQRASEIEALIKQTAQTRCDILVTAVYWRMNEQLGAQLPARGASGTGAAVRPPAVRPPPMLSSRPAPLMPPAAAPSPPIPTPRFDPIEPDEVEAFKQALAHAAALRPAATASAPAPLQGATPRRSGPLLPPNPADFEDTLMPSAPEGGRSADLSNTQYGDLR
ncbi:hypothetical protein DFR36_103110 [Melaminivora alkalimesophila]|uniref:Uncharacterized protein n=1 Tax=Melaminivora alkalimesophila TaxID=1165852 RepID=A0A317RDR9_9BURK|nr:hypothetical protein [Melaminivora alkalimesophila]PWW46835.1 hypothetical protein DFR36_103110 [Melaminivora alkalimesophila]